MKKLSVKALSFALSLLLLAQGGAVAVNAAAAPGKVTSLQSYNIDDDEVNLKWKSVKNADGYQVYVYSDKWRYAGATTKLYYEVDDLLSAKKYRFKVRAYDVRNGKKVYGSYSAVLSAVTRAEEVDDVRVSAKNKNFVTLRWSAVRNARGYQVYVYNSAKKKYEKYANFSKTTATVKKLKAGTNYYFKVRAYFKLDSKYYYGAFSDTLKVKTSAAVQAKQPTAAKSNASYIGSSKAGSIALNHAGLKKSQVREFEVSFDNERGVQVYEVDFEYGRYDYEYEINAVSGKILHYEKSVD